MNTVGTASGIVSIESGPSLELPLGDSLTPATPPCKKQHQIKEKELNYIQVCFFMPNKRRRYCSITIDMGGVRDTDHVYIWVSVKAQEQTYLLQGLEHCQNPQRCQVSTELLVVGSSKMIRGPQRL